MSERLSEAAARVTRDMKDVRGSEWTPERVRGAKVAAWRSAFAGLDFHLTWERDEGADEFHYDVIVTAENGESVVVSYCPDRRMPFVARGAQRVGEHQLLRVNGQPVTTQEAMAELEIGHDGVALRELAQRTLLRQLIDRADPAVVTPSEDELRDAGDAFRVQHGLFDAKDTVRWLEERGMTWKMLLARLRRDVMVAKLREHVTANQVDAHFAVHGSDFDRVLVEELTLEPWADADAFVARARDGESLYTIGARAVRTGEARVFSTRAVRALDLAAVTVEGANAGVRSGTDGSAVVYRVVERTAAVLDDETIAAVAEHLFKRWLDARMSETHLEWQWGVVPARAADELAVAGVS